MSTTVPLPKEVLHELFNIAQRNKFPQILEILDRSDDSLIVNDILEAAKIIECAKFHMMGLFLKYPNWSDAYENYDPVHDKICNDFQMEVFEKVVSYLNSHNDFYFHCT